jgi:hypothetical protein
VDCSAEHGTRFLTSGGYGDPLRATLCIASTHPLILLSPALLTDPALTASAYLLYLKDQYEKRRLGRPVP